MVFDDSHIMYCESLIMNQQAVTMTEEWFMKNCDPPMMTGLPSMMAASSYSFRAYRYLLSN